MYSKSDPSQLTSELSKVQNIPIPVTAHRDLRGAMTTLVS